MLTCELKRRETISLIKMNVLLRIFISHPDGYSYFSYKTLKKLNRWRSCLYGGCANPKMSLLQLSACGRALHLPTDKVLMGDLCLCALNYLLNNSFRSSVTMIIIIKIFLAITPFIQCFDDWKRWTVKRNQQQWNVASAENVWHCAFLIDALNHTNKCFKFRDSPPLLKCINSWKGTSVYYYILWSSTRKERVLSLQWITNNFSKLHFGSESHVSFWDISNLKETGRFF